MKKKLGTLLFLIVSIGALLSCNNGIFMLVFGEDVDSRSTTLTTIEPPATVAGLTKYSFIVIADPHFGASKVQKTDNFIAWFQEYLATADAVQKPRFLVNVGDTLDGGHKSEADEFNTMMQRMEAIAMANGLSEFKSYSILGNHDLYHHGWDVWKKEIYPYVSYYKFATQGFSWYFIDTGNGTMGKEQLEDFEAQLKADANPKLVFSHYAIYCSGIFEYCMQNTLERNRLITAFAKNKVHTVFEGHDHREHTFYSSSFDEHALTSFLYGYKFALVTIDEDAGTVSCKEISFD